MTDEAMSPLRRRMIERYDDPQVSAEDPTRLHPARSRFFAAFLGRSPDTASFEDVRRFQLHLAANGAHIPIVNHTVAALRFFFRITLRRSTSSSTRRSSTSPGSCRSCSVRRRWRGCWMQRGAQIQGSAERGLWRGSAAPPR